MVYVVMLGSRYLTNYDIDPVDRSIVAHFHGKRSMANEMCYAEALLIKQILESVYPGVYLHEG